MQNDCSEKHSCIALPSCAESLAKVVLENADKLDLEGLNSWLHFWQSLLALDTASRKTKKLHATGQSLMKALQAAVASKDRLSSKVYSPLWWSYHKATMVYNVDMPLHNDHF